MFLSNDRSLDELIVVDVSRSLVILDSQFFLNNGLIFNRIQVDNFVFCIDELDLDIISLENRLEYWLINETVCRNDNSSLLNSGFDLSWFAHWIQSFSDFSSLL